MFDFSLLSAMFWLLVLVALQPFRFSLSVIAFLLLTNLDMSGVWFDSSTAVGWENAIKSVVLPAWLLARGWWMLTRTATIGAFLRRIVTTPAFGIWLSLVFYVAVASLRSPAPLSAVKMVGALTSHTVVFLALSAGYLAGRIKQSHLAWTVLLMILIGALQSLVLAGTYESHASILWSRFTSFASPQSFAMGIVTIATMLLWSRRWSTFEKAAGIAVVFGVLLLNGSRIGFLGAVASFPIWLTAKPSARRLTVLALILVAAAAIFSFNQATGYWAESRLGEATAALDSESGGVETVSTFAWRRHIYECTWDEIRSRSTRELILGSGTSSAILLDGICVDESKLQANPNRLLHSEWLRVLYEFGLGGFALLAGLVFILLRTAWQAWTPWKTRGMAISESIGPLASITPLLFLAFSFENVLQAAGTPGATAFALILAQGAAGSARQQAGHGGQIPTGSFVHTPELDTEPEAIEQSPK